MKPAKVTKRLRETARELARLRAELDVLDEQVAHLAQVERDAATDAAVAGTALAAREHRTAAEDLRRATRHRDEIAHRIADLTAEQDHLLELLQVDDTTRSP